MAENIETVGIIKIETGQAEKNTKSLKQQLKEVRDEMGRLAANGDRTSEAYKKLAARAGELAKAQREVTKDVSEASTTFTNTVSYTAGALSGVSGAVQTVTGALSMMGIEMGNDSKLMKILVAAMSVTSGLTAIQNSVESFKLLATNIKRATGEQKLLNAVMKLTPTGLLAAGVAAVIAVIGKLNNKYKETLQHQEYIRKERAKNYTSAMTEIRTMNELIKVAKDQNKSYTDRATAVEMLNSKYPGLVESFNKENGQLKLNTQAYTDYTKAIIAAATAKAAEEKITNLENQILENTQKAADIRANAQKAASRTRTSALPMMTPGTAPAQSAGQRQENNADEIIKRAEAQAKGLEDENDELNKQINRYVEIATQAEIDAEKIKGYGKTSGTTTATPTKAETEQADKDLEKYCEILDSFRTARQKEIDDATEQYSADYDILEKYGDDTTELTERYNKKLQEINDKYDREEKDLEFNADKLQSDRDYNDEKLAILKDGKENYLEQLEALDMKQFQVEKDLLKEQRELGLIEEQEYQDALTEIQIREIEKRNEAEKAAVEKHKETLQNAMTATQTILSSTNTILEAWASKMADDGEEETNQYKAIKKAEAIISMLAGEVQVIAGVAGKNPTPWGIAAAVAQGAALAATCMETIHQIDAVTTSTSTASVNTATTATLSRNYTNTRLTDGSGAEVDLGNEISKAVGNIKVVVSAREITDTQNKMKQVKVRNNF